MTIVSLSLDGETLRKFDDLRSRRGYRSRSEAVRDALKEFIDEAEWTSDAGANTLILSVVYEKGPPKSALASLQHRFDEIRTMLHTHLDERNCLEILIAEGASPRLKELVRRIRGIPGVKQIKFIRTAFSA